MSWIIKDFKLEATNEDGAEPADIMVNGNSITNHIILKQEFNGSTDVIILDLNQLQALVDLVSNEGLVE